MGKYTELAKKYKKERDELRKKIDKLEKSGEEAQAALMELSALLVGGGKDDAN